MRQKSYRNGFGKGERLDYERIMVILLQVDHGGPLSIVYEGQARGGDRVDAVRSLR